MLSLGGGEVMVVLLVALVVLGPDKLPETARKIGNIMAELRRMSAGVQEELRTALNDATAEPASADIRTRTPESSDADRDDTSGYGNQEGPDREAPAA